LFSHFRPFPDTAKRLAIGSFAPDGRQLDATLSPADSNFDSVLHCSDELL
jgi:hypothetical protein